ncbi:hypothetical protein cbdbA174 [Dehalococcoides mccartyi CBDB1]|uniref:Uncharacterized protein n=2 Tax=Dehalococcoides mccartyi TaxID=61435 RepID=A0A142V7Z6_9CHLR|nr:hypothetical protein Dm11a5_0111 [Dehalococcoides mccartyi]AOV98817.1 hypothetical protein DCWBC2_0142 [Dehalococcoides mccartyi]MBA2084574.1 hypothetical protein [Dehalococcoides mccartyi]CAI82424.1 hypothetical protein cbdbA174 [Dehalococcoides mccartyi CBDB1]
MTSACPNTYISNRHFFILSNFSDISAVYRQVACYLYLYYNLQTVTHGKVPESCTI